MKTKLTILILAVSTMLMAQKKKNGAIYIEHPANQVVLDFLAAFSQNDSLAVANLIADDYKGYDGLNMNPDRVVTTKADLLEAMKNWNNLVSHLNIEHTSSGYPDAVEYDDAQFSGGTWVYSWERYTGMHTKTGIKLNMPAHFQYVVNDDNKIVYSRSYVNKNPFTAIRRNSNEVVGGTVYSHHENINKVRKMIHSYEFNDLEGAYEYYNEDTNFKWGSMDWDAEPVDLEAAKASDKEFMSTFAINTINNSWIEYQEMESGWNFVQSFWRVDVTRKADNKNIVFGMYMTHVFDDDNKITRVRNLFNAAALQ